MTRPLDHYCRVCRYALDRWAEPGKPEVFIHAPSYANWTGPAHEPDLVPRAELLSMNEVCDFCSRRNPTWAYKFVDVTSDALFANDEGATASFTSNFGPWWSVCTQCAILVEARDLEGLLKRVRLTSGHGAPMDVIRASMGPVYQELLSHPWERTPIRRTS